MAEEETKKPELDPNTDVGRFLIKEKNDSLRAALREAHEDHRQALGMIFKTTIVNGTIFAGLVTFYVAMPVGMLKFPVWILGAIACYMGIRAQRHSIRAFRVNAIHFLIPVRGDLEIRRSDVGDAKNAREKLENKTKILLFQVYLVFSIVWIVLAYFNHYDVLYTAFNFLKGLKNG